MLRVIASRTLNSPMRQTLQQKVVINGYDRLTPKAARAALEIAFGNSDYGDVFWELLDRETGETKQSYGYHVYAKSHRKFYADR